MALFPVLLFLARSFFAPRLELVAEILALRQQMAILNRTSKRPSLAMVLLIGVAVAQTTRLLRSQNQLFSYRENSRDMFFVRLPVGSVRDRLSLSDHGGVAIMPVLSAKAGKSAPAVWVACVPAPTDDENGSAPRRSLWVRIRFGQMQRSPSAP
jgi:hypothetical protein